MVRLIQLAFVEGRLPEELTWETMILPPKGKWEYRGIGLVEVAQKLFTLVMNLWMKKGVDHRDSLNGFREGSGMGMATLEANLDHQLAGIFHETLFQVFIDVQKAYDLLDRGICLDILRWYGLGTNMARLLAHYWEKQRIVPMEGKFLGRPFRTGQGVTRGDPASSMVFNIVVDTVVQEVLEEVCRPK